jgi:DNA adenine methylase
MKYMGSKNRIAKEILPIILKDRKPGQWYVEPFVGGANMIDKVDGLRIGADSNPFVIEALKFIRDTPGLFPDHISEYEYNSLKRLKPLDGFTGIVGFAMSFGAKWFGGYRREVKGVSDKANELTQTRRAKQNVIEQSPLLQGIIFINSVYTLLDIPRNSIIYCDPPYQGTTKYKYDFDSVAFWNWVRALSLLGHSVFVSEYEAPEDFICVWEKQVTTTFSTSKDIKATEKLFIFNDLY